MIIERRDAEKKSFFSVGYGRTQRAAQLLAEDTEYCRRLTQRTAELSAASANVLDILSAFSQHQCSSQIPSASLRSL